MIKPIRKETELPRIAMAMEVSFSKPFSKCLYKFFIYKHILNDCILEYDPKIPGHVLQSNYALQF
jgi:hypothetical protein